MKNAWMRFSDLVVARLSTVTGVLVFLAASSLPLMAQAKEVFAYVGDTTSYFEAAVELGAGSTPESMSGLMLANGGGTFSIISTPGCGPSTTVCSINANFHPGAAGQYEAVFEITYDEGPAYFKRPGWSLCKPGSGCVTVPKAPKFFIRTKSAVMGDRG